MIRSAALAAMALVSLSEAAPARHHRTLVRAGKSVPARALTVPVTVTVQISMFAFAPRVLSIAPGTTVTWTNVDEEPHTVTAVGGAFHSTALDTHDKYSFIFSKVGDYAYFCRLHPQMTGRVVVRAK
jgi:plastocyanin